VTCAHSRSGLAPSVAPMDVVSLRGAIVGSSPVIQRVVERESRRLHRRSPRASDSGLRRSHAIVSAHGVHLLMGLVSGAIFLDRSRAQQ